MNIPGLIANKKDDSKLTSAELQAKRDSFEAYIKSWKSEEDTLKSQALSNVSNLNQVGTAKMDLLNQYMTGIDPYKDAYINTPMQPFQPMWEHQPYDQGLKASPNRKLETQDMARYLQEYLKPKKSEFEVLLDAMFDTSEKEQFLITLGFEFYHENGEDWIKREVAGFTEKARKSDSFDKIFLREMTIKFKNLLISKNSLKLKI